MARAIVPSQTVLVLSNDSKHTQLLEPSVVQSLEGKTQTWSSVEDVKGMEAAMSGQQNTVFNATDFVGYIASEYVGLNQSGPLYQVSSSPHL